MVVFVFNPKSSNFFVIIWWKSLKISSKDLRVNSYTYWFPSLWKRKCKLDLMNQLNVIFLSFDAYLKLSCKNMLRYKVSWCMYTNRNALLKNCFEINWLAILLNFFNLKWLLRSTPERLVLSSPCLMYLLQDLHS